MRSFRRASQLRLRSLVAVLALALAGCSINPVTGRPEFNILSRSRELELGREAAVQVAAQIGLVDDAALVAYVGRVGERLARHSPRRDVTCQFFVVDMPEPNAFALPGGWVYVSRGLLAITNSEDELANVLGHEIGHVAARHAAQRHTRAAGVGLLSTASAVVAGVAGGGEAAASAASAGQILGGGLLAAYSRDQEREADEVGQQLALDAGYRPEAMSSFLRTLRRRSELDRGGPRQPGFLDTHPTPHERVLSTRHRARELGAPAEEAAISRAAFLEHLEGLLLGPDPAGGVFRDGVFIHPGLGFELRLPEDWETHNTRTAVVALAPSKDGALVLEVEGPPDAPVRAALRFGRAHDLALEDREERTIHGYRAYTAHTKVPTRTGHNAAVLTWIELDRVLVRLTGLTPGTRFKRHRDSFATATASVRPVSRARLAAITERRLRVVPGRAGETLPQLGKRTGNRWSPQETAVANGLPPDVRLERGQLVKVAIQVPFTDRES